MKKLSYFISRENNYFLYIFIKQIKSNCKDEKYKPIN